jgi:hypothetical protein
MQLLATILGAASGFLIMGYHDQAPEIIATSLVVDASLAPLTGVIAAHRGWSPARWSIIGFPFGVWALGLVLLLRSTRRERSDRPFPPSDAA